MQVGWQRQATDDLLALRGDAGWGYRPGAEPFAEPTVLACLALLAGEPSDDVRRLVRQSAEWLAAIQQPAGAVGLSKSLPEPFWPTSLALWLWSVLDVGFDSAKEKATLWLLEQKGQTFDKTPDDPVGHDTTIAGWPWVSDTHSWLEPTAYAILALQSEGMSDTKRVDDGRRLIRDRAIVTGGWNYGNSSAFNTPLRPAPATTGLALMALAGTKQDTVVERGVAYLQKTLPAVRSAQSLCFGVLGWSAWAPTPAESAGWFEEAFAKSRRRSDPAPQLAYLLLGSAPRAASLLKMPIRGSSREKMP